MYRRLREQDFQEQVENARAEIVKRAVAKLSAASVKAVETLTALLRSEHDFARLAAARAILEIGTKTRRDDILLERIAALEAGQSPASAPTSWPPRAS